MKTSKERDLCKALVLTASGLTGLVAIFPGDGSNVRYRVHCADGSSLEPENIDELLSLPNPKSRAIDKISIKTEYGTQPSVTVNFKVSDFGGADYTISGEDAEVVYISNIIDQHLEPMIQRYSMISVGQGRFMISPFFWITGVGLMVASSHPVRSHLSVGGSEHLWQVIYLFGFATFLASFFIRRLLLLVFPSMVFCVGDGLTRHENAVSLRRQLGFAAILTIILGVISSVIATRIFT